MTAETIKSLRALAAMPSRKPDDESIVAYFSDGRSMYFSKDEVIIQGYEEPEGVYLIKSGFVKAYSISHDGHRKLLLIHKTGEFIPLPWALDGAHTTGMFYEAMTDVEVLRAGKNKLRSALGHDSWLSREILSQTVNIISIYTSRIQTLEYRSARERVIAELIYLGERFGQKRGKEFLINAPITHQDIADSINMSRETASRALEMLFEEGLMGQKDRLFTIKDIDSLRTALG
ncbi:MAG TPA: Crp/Fnr family transcriptional regulator [Candidatus Saccharimonadales bacterium]|nr:Crp/Fnr family transcriptional regulator [Candidatus Saccharimonadales bacterium]